MSEIAKSGTSALTSSTGPVTPRIEGALAGEALGALDACYIRTTDSRVYRSLNNPAGYNAAVTGMVPPNTVHGYVTAAANPGDRVALVYGVQATYGAGLVPPAPLYLSGTVPGGLTDVAPTAGAPAIAHAATATQIACEWLAGVKF